MYGYVSSCSMIYVAELSSFTPTVYCCSAVAPTVYCCSVVAPTMFILYAGQSLFEFVCQRKDLHTVGRQMSCAPQKGVIFYKCPVPHKRVLFFITFLCLTKGCYFYNFSLPHKRVLFFIIFLCLTKGSYFL